MTANNLERFRVLSSSILSGQTIELSEALRNTPECREWRDEAGCTLLRASIEAGNTDAAALLISTGADVNAAFPDHYSYLHLAVELGGSKGIVVGKLLLEKHADPEARALNDWTVLHHAAARGYARFVEILLQHGANVNARTRDYGEATPLIEAVSWSENSRVVELLLRSHADRTWRMSGVSQPWS